MTLESARADRIAVEPGTASVRSDSDLLDACINALRFGVVVTDADGIAVRTNRIALERLGRVEARTRAGWALTSLGTTEEAVDEWQAGIDAAAAGHRFLFSASLRDERIVVAASRCGMSRYLMFRFEPHWELTSEVVDFLRRHYRLTPAEVRVVRGLVEGQTPAEIADSHHVSESTIRTQVKHALSKTGSRNISQMLIKVTRHLVM